MRGIEVGDSWWARERARRLAELRESIRKGLVDRGVLDVLETINSREYYFTTSSCSGRIIVLAAPSPGNKRRASVLGKWHRMITADELHDALARRPAEALLVWASAQGPIIHVASRDLDHASVLLRAGHLAGLKHACIHVLDDRRIIVELRSAERVDIPLVFRGRDTGIDVDIAAQILNYYLALGKQRLERLRRALALMLGY